MLVSSFLLLTWGLRMECTGRVKWFNATKGFGFIVSDSKEYFAHYSDVIMDGFKVIDEGDRVKFKALESQKGPVAKCIEIISKAKPRGDV